MALNSPSHYFHAEAHALSGKLDRPFEEEIKKQAFVKLATELAGLSEQEKAQRSYFSQHAKNFRLEGIISYVTAHTQVSGHESKKHPGASVTLATSVVEGLNVLNVVTADRVVAQISTTHFPDEHAPLVTFLGTHFENLRIFRHKVFPKLNLRLCGDPVAAEHRFVQSAGFLKSVRDQHNALADSVKGLRAAVQKDEKRRNRELNGLRDLPGLVEQEYNAALLQDDRIQERIIAAEKKVEEEGLEAGHRLWPGIKCSLVDKVEIELPSKEQISEPIRPYGHVIHVPDFGKILLADLTVNHNSFDLTMIRLELGCLADGKVSVTNCSVNGGHKP